MTTDNARNALKGQLESIRELAAAFRTAELFGDGTENGNTDKQRDAIQAEASSVEVRGGWYCPGGDGDIGKPEEFQILLANGGPAVRILGDLDDNNLPCNPVLQCQDWGTPWETCPLTDEEEADLQLFCEQFYFGD